MFRQKIDQLNGARLDVLFLVPLTGNLLTVNSDFAVIHKAQLSTKSVRKTFREERNGPRPMRFRVRTECC